MRHEIQGILTDRGMDSQHAQEAANAILQLFERRLRTLNKHASIMRTLTTDWQEFFREQRVVG